MFSLACNVQIIMSIGYMSCTEEVEKDRQIKIQQKETK